MKKSVIVLLLLAGCLGGFDLFKSEDIDCGEDVQAPRVPVDVVRAYAPAILKSSVENAPLHKCVDKRYVGLVPPPCKGEGWGCGVLDPYFWGFAEKGQPIEAFVFDVPGRGVGLWFEVSKQPDRKVIVCEFLPVKKGMESVHGLMKDFCYSDAGEFTQDASFCSKIASPDVRIECEARTFSDVKKCDLISNKSAKSKCISDVARIFDDVRLCERISDALEQGNCRLSVEGLKLPSKGAVIAQN